MLVRKVRPQSHCVPTESPIDLAVAVAASSAQSQYARALGRAYGALESVSAFHEGALGEADLQTALHLD